MKSIILGIAHGVRVFRASAGLAHGVGTTGVCIYDTTRCFESVSERERAMSVALDLGVHWERI